MTLIDTVDVPDCLFFTSFSCIYWCHKLQLGDKSHTKRANIINKRVEMVGQVDRQYAQVKETITQRKNLYLLEYVVG